MLSRPRTLTAYTLPPDKYAQARGLARIGYVAGILIPLYSILVLYLMLRWGWSAKFRDWAEARTSQPFYQAGIYCAAFFTRLYALKTADSRVVPLAVREERSGRAGMGILARR